MTSKVFMDSLRDGPMGMMGVMGPMMGGGGNFNSKNWQDFDMWEMGRQMMSFMFPDNGYNASIELANTTSEIRVLFEEWLGEIEKETIELMKETNSVDPETVASHLKISRNSAEYLISRIEDRRKS